MLALAAALLILGSTVRALLFAHSAAALRELSSTELFEVVAMGFRLDAVFASYLLIPAMIALLVPARAALLPQRICAGAAIAVAALAYAAELLFFSFYGTRLNYLVLEHGSDPEVWRAIQLSYLGLGLPLLGALAAGTWLVYMLLCTRFRRALARSAPRAWTNWAVRLVLIAGIGIAARGTIDHRPLNPSAAVVTTNRVANEIAGSGPFSVTYEAVRRWRHESPSLRDLLPMPSDERLWVRARALFARRGQLTEDSPNPLLYTTPNRERSSRPTNVVVVVMESFTGRLVGAMGGQPALSPELDALSKEGLLLTNCYATGERTVQGLEAVLSSFPPLPGVAALRRPEAQTGFATLASVLGERGYDTLFLYGGQGIFDHMSGFALGNGFRTFIEEKDFENPHFQGSWGVSDEDLFARANREFQQRFESHKPFFGAILTVSLHTPWEFPRDGVRPLPEGTPVPKGFEREELANFLYADYAVGQFIREARKLPYFEDTVFVFVGDHGVHLQGNAMIPSEEYRVPALFLAPAHIAPERRDEVASQLDLAPTILGLLGGEFRSPFFGRDVLHSSPEDGLGVLVYQKRRYGIRRGDRLTVLDERGRRAAYRVLPSGQVEAAESSPANEEDSSDLLAILAVAEDLLESKRYTIARR